MVRLKLEEDRPTPKDVYNWKVYFYAGLACWGSVMIGYDSAFIGTTIGFTSFEDEFGLTSKAAEERATLSENIVSCYQAGCFFGALGGYFVGYYLGRKWGLFVAAMIFNIGAILQMVSSSKTGLGIMYAGRAIAGLGVGAASNLTPVYVTEISPPAIRGRLIGIAVEAGWQTGAVIGFWINYGISLHIPVSNKQWLIPFAVQLIPGGMLAISGILLRESPRWLASKNRHEAALRNLCHLRNLPPHDPYIVAEMQSTRSSIEADQLAGGAGLLGPLRTLFGNRNYLKRLAIAVGLFAMQNGTGINAINYYSPTVFASIGVSGNNTSLLTTGVFGILKFLGAVVWLLLLVDRYGRKSLLIWGAAGGAISMYYIGAYIAIAKPADDTSTSLSSGGISAMVFFYLWTCFYGPTWNGTPWVFGAEIFPTYIRAGTQAIVAASNWLFAFLIARFTPQMFLSMGYGVYLFFASLMIISIVIVYLIVPETAQMPLEKMDLLFATGVPAWRARALADSTGHTITDEKEGESRQSQA